MKIGQFPPLPVHDGTGRTPGRPSSDDPQAEDATRVTLSRDAAFVADMRSKADRALPTVREDVVAEVKAELEAGTFEDRTDMERVVDGLLADL